ncbi:aspartate/methionine/tyrosine aminotransferase [Novosphingobium kunmingense]|uniref:Aminotransferase n=1 Tax=Novosphingobium kunmingense TaxID=1211806 RepID=A0A2N0I386_9SPHN|nr:aminotransferase class I/II-fold pyridoxal phosphate-dependent enzyme [Novosphingobium kunmingense]PKB25630.1 aspartate/methionine/tyrosine aminotransferase [Novosphingobium kunmingense]
MTAEIEPFHAIRVSLEAHRLKSEGGSIIHMEFGQPSTGAPAAAIARAHEVLDSDPMGYWQSPALKERICRHYREVYRVTVDPAQIVLTCGASPALVLALSVLFEPGARVAMARPGYVAYRNTLKTLHLEPVELDCGEEAGFQLTAAVVAALDPPPQGLILASPANPTGTIIPRAELVAIARVCAEHGIALVSDEIYHGIAYGAETPSILEVDPGAMVINSFSKYFSMAGWRLGWLVAPLDKVDAAIARMSNLFLTPPSLSQHVGLVAMDCPEELEANVETYRRNRELLLCALPNMGLARIAPPDGAFYIYADVSDFTDDSMDLALALLRDTGVATAPGIDFDPMLGHHFLRISFAVSTPEVEEAIARMGPWFASRNRGRRQG